LIPAGGFCAIAHAAGPVTPRSARAFSEGHLEAGVVLSAAPGCTTIGIVLL